MDPHNQRSTAHCLGVLTLSMTSAMCPRTKHINVKYHHFRAVVAQDDVTVHTITTDLQQVNILTKPNSVIMLRHHRKRVMG